MTARVLLLISLVLWATCFVSSFALARLITPDGWWLLALLDKVIIFLVWQGVAALVAIIVWVIGIWVDKAVKWRWVRWVPITITAVLLLGLSLLSFSASSPVPVPEVPSDPSPVSLPDTD